MGTPSRAWAWSGSGAVVATALAGVLCLSACARLDGFRCAESSECAHGGQNGTCEPTGYCSFPDLDCITGRRYGTYSGPHAGTCVGSEIASDAVSAPGDAASAPGDVTAGGDGSTEGGGGDSGTDSGDAGDSGISCEAGASCPSDDPCKTSTIDCSSGVAECTTTGNARNGTSCGAGMVCASGACVACASGASCVPPQDPCHQGALDCSTGAPVCAATSTPVANGTSCGTDKVCGGGSCNPCAAGTSCTGSSACKTAVIVCTSGNPVCTDTGNQPNKTSCGGGNVCTDGVCGPPPSVILNFPQAGDTFQSTADGYYWVAGNYVSGSRTTTLDSTTSATIHVVLSGNLLSCDTETFNVLINGATVGSFVASAGVTTVDTTLTYAACTGPTYALEYVVAKTVASGCGSVAFATSGSTITLK
jgi:hypothetical protein